MAKQHNHLIVLALHLLYFFKTKKVNSEVFFVSLPPQFNRVCSVDDTTEKNILTLLLIKNIFL